MQHRFMFRVCALLISGLLGTGVCQAAKKSAAAAAARQSIPQLMREYGFKHQTASWISKMVQTDETGKKTEGESRIFISGNKYRMETKDRQSGKTQIMLDDGQDMYMYTPDEKKALKWGPAMETMFGSVMNSDMVSESVRQRKAAKKLGSEAVDGKPCDIFAYTSKLNVMNNVVTSDVREWVWAKENFPLKSVVKTPKYQMKIVFMTTDVPASETVNTIRDLVLDKPVDDSLFTLPAGTKIETLENPPDAAGGGENAPEKQRPSKGSKVEKSQDSEEPASGDASGEETPPAPAPDVQKLIKGLF